MSSRRTLILIGAIVIGGLAAFLTLNYVRGVENDNAAKNQLVEVLVANGPIATGTDADEAIASKAIVAAKRRRADLPSNVITRSAEVSGQVSALDLSGGEVLTSAMFVSPEQRTGSNASVLDKGNVAMSVQVDTASGVADLIRVGDSINIMAKVTIPKEGEGAEEITGIQRAGERWKTADPYVTVLQNVKVIAIDNIIDAPKSNANTAPDATAEGAGAAPTPQTSNGLITVQLPPEQAQLLASVQSAGLYMTLNRPDYEPQPIPFEGDLPTFGGQIGVTPYPASANGAKGQ